MNIVNLTIGRRLWLGFSLLMVLLVAMSTLGVNRLSELNQQMNEVIHNRYPKTVLASDINNQINVVARSIRNILLLKDPKQIRFESDRITAADKIVQERLATLDKVIDPENRGLLTTLLTTQKAYLEKRDKVLRMANEGARENATDVLITEVRPVQSAYMAAIEQLIARQRELMSESADAVGQDYQNASHLLIGLAAAGLLLAAAIAYAVTRSITVPLIRAVQVARTVASGDLTSQIDSSARDETGQLLEALKTMNDNLLTVVRQVRRGTDTIATATKEIASGNLDLSSRTEQQAGSLEETASAMEQLTSTVRQNADNVRQASQLAVSASEVAIQGGAVVGEVVNTMSSINESSKKIVDIISVIDGIAFQTNILALNAAVEAARAGEQGRGFAVVASEVRSLAQRSATAAREIKILISDSVDKVDAGSKLVEQAGTTMHDVVTSVRRVTDIVGEISTAGQEQSAGIEQVNRAIVLIDETTQQNAALVEEAAAAAQSLQDQANRLVEVIDVFTLDEHIGQIHGDARAAIGHPGMSATPLALTSR